MAAIVGGAGWLGYAVWNAVDSADKGGDADDADDEKEPERVLNPTKADSPVWKKATPWRDGLRRHGDEIWDWDNTHNDIEVYDPRGNHKGSRNPTTGEMYKPAVRGRWIKI
jgi:filamentous hemagglutinin